jgi:hypothetical protein
VENFEDCLVQFDKVRAPRSFLRVRLLCMTDCCLDVPVLLQRLLMLMFVSIEIYWPGSGFDI